MVETITIYNPRIWSRRLHEGKERWKVVVAHRRAGKTTASLNHLIRDAVNIPKAKFAYVGPTYKQSKNIAWDILKEYARKIDGVSFNESELRADFANGSRITLYGSDNPDALRGMGLWGVIFDEYSQQPSNVFTEIIRPALADHRGYAIWIGTPKGKNDFYRLYEHARQDDDWLGILLRVSDTGLIDREELMDSKKVMTDDEYQQEWYCSFEAAIKGAYYAEEIAKARKDNRFTKVDWDSMIGVFTVWDLGISTRSTAPAGMSVGFFQKVRQEIRLIDYHETIDKGFDWWSKFLKEKPYTYLKHFAPHDIKVPEMSSGKSRMDIAKDLGIKFEVVPNLGVADGVHAGRLMFSRLWVDEVKCQLWLDYIAQYRREWDDNKGMFKDKPLHDFTSHAADMYRYTAVSEDLMNSERGALLTDDLPTTAKSGIIIKSGHVSEEEMLPKEEPKDWRYQ